MLILLINWKITILVFSLSDKTPIGRNIFHHLDKFNDKSFISQIFYCNPLCLQIAGWYLEFVLLNKMKYEKQTRRFFTLIFLSFWKTFFQTLYWIFQRMLQKQISSLQLGKSLRFDLTVIFSQLLELIHLLKTKIP